MKKLLYILLLLPSIAFAQLTSTEVKAPFVTGGQNQPWHMTQIVDYVDQEITSVETQLSGISSGATALGIIYVDSDTTVNGWDIASNTHVIGSNGAVITALNQSTNMGGLVLDGVSNVTLEGLIIDLATPNSSGGAEPNFSTCITIRDSENITIKNCTFINSGAAGADPAWTLHAIESQNAKNIKVIDNYSNGCQFKIAGAQGSMEDLIFMGNQVDSVTQMGISVVVQAQTGSDIKLENLIISNNTFNYVDSHGVYIGIDDGLGIYGGTVSIKDVTISNNQIRNLHYLGGQSSKGILVRLTRDSENISITNNTIWNTAENTQVQGIHVVTVETDSLQPAKNINISGNHITRVGSFNMYLQWLDFFQVKDNISTEGRGIRMIDCTDGQAFGNMFRDSEASLRIESCTGVVSDKLYANSTAAAAEGVQSGQFFYQTATGISVVP